MTIKHDSPINEQKAFIEGAIRTLWVCLKPTLYLLDEENKQFVFKAYLTHFVSEGLIDEDLLDLYWNIYLTLDD